MPSSTAALVAETASSMRCLRSFISTSVCAPTCDDGDATGELGQPLLQLLPVPLRVGALDLAAQLGDAVGHRVVCVRPPSTMVVVSLVTTDPTRRPEHLETDLGELEPDLRRDHLTTGEDGHVLEHRLAAVAEAWRLDGRDAAGRPGSC